MGDGKRVKGSYFWGEFVEFGSCMMWGALERYWVNLKLDLLLFFRGNDNLKGLDIF